jgi:hypothetical protein
MLLSTYFLTEFIYKVTFTAEQAMKAQKGSRAIIYSFFNLGARLGWWSMPRPRRFTPGNHCIGG